MTKKRTAPFKPTMVEKSITDYIPDAHNANKGTERGLQMIENGLNKLGVGRSIVADKNGKLPAGNKTLEAAVNAGIEKVIEIETDGHALIVHKRTDWDLDDPLGPAREYAYLDNRASEIGLSWDANQIVADAQVGLNMDGFFQPWELANFTGLITPPDPIDRQGMWQGMPSYEQNELLPYQTIKVHFATKEDADAFSKLVGQVINPVTKFIFYPKLKDASRRSHQIIDEGDGETGVDTEGAAE